MSFWGPGVASRFGGTLASRIARAGVTEISGFGTNPGALRMFSYAPVRLPGGRPLVVVLHGCGQDAKSFSADAGWLALAEEARLALVLPEQMFENNRGRCFSWYNPEDVRRGGGEAMSIRQMISRAVARFRADPRRIFIAGFSAGAAMAAAMLAAYPAVFAAGAVVAGMPVGCARTQVSAVLRMRRADGFRTRGGLAEDVRAVTGAATRKKWPRLSIWQGERDRTVAPENAELLAAQWSELHGFPDQPTRDETPAAGVRHRTWSRGDRPPSVEIWTLAGLGHGFPIHPGGQDGGRAGPWVVDAGLSGARLMADFWGIAPMRQ